MLRSGIRLSPSDIRYASLRGEYNITATNGSNITVACNNITPTKSAYHLCFNIAFVSTNAVLVKKIGQRNFMFSVLFLLVARVLLYCRHPFVLFFWKNFKYLLTNDHFSVYNVKCRNGKKLSESEVHLSEKNLSAQKASEKSRARLQKENEHCQRQKGSQEKTSEGQSKTVLLSFLQDCPWHV